MLTAVLAVYGFTIGHDYNIDDGFYFQTMPEEGSGFAQVFSVFAKDKLFSEVDYRPTTSFFLSLEQYFFGRSPMIFHLFNVFYYWMLGICLIVVFRRFEVFKKDWHILLFAGVFLLHPSHANVVASIKNRDVILATMFALVGVIFLYKVFMTQKKPYVRFLYLIAALLFGYTASLTKTDGIFLFLILPLVIFYKHERFTWVLVIGAGSLLTIMILRYLHSTNLGLVDQSLTKMLVTEFSNPLAGTNDAAAIFEMQAKGFWHYLKFQIVPIEYHFYYGFDMIPLNGRSNLPFIGGLLAAIFLGITTLVLYFRKRQQLIALGIAIFLALTFPYILFIHEIAGIVAVRYGFYGSLGFAMVLSALLIELHRRNKKAGIAGIAVLCVLMAFFSVLRAIDWKDHKTLYSHDIPKLERSYVANRMVGEFYLEEIRLGDDPAGRSELISKSKVFIGQAIRLYDEDPVTLKHMGEIYTLENNADSAYYYYSIALEHDPDRVSSWKSLAQFAIRAGNNELLEMAAAGILKIDSLDADGIVLMNDALFNRGEFQRCLDFNKEIMSLDNSNYIPYLYTAKIYEDSGDRLNALVNYFEAFERGFIDDRLQRNLVNFVINRNLEDVRKAYPSYFP